MAKRFLSLLLIIALLLSASIIGYACDEKQSEYYITHILFGSRAASRQSKEPTIMLLSALFLCSEQSNGIGEEKLNFLQERQVPGIPPLISIDINEKYLPECSHNKWEYKSQSVAVQQTSRKQLLQNTVNTVFKKNSLPATEQAKIDSFAILLYYLHILTDYIADNPSNTRAVLQNRRIPSYSGVPLHVLNGNEPTFNENEKSTTEPFIQYSKLDHLGRAGKATACIGYDQLQTNETRANMYNIRPVGFSISRYDSIINSTPGYLYNRCHLIAHSLGGKEELNNLITGTRYLNETGMLSIETKVQKYIQRTHNHVYYRVTPIYKSNNLIASGVQIEAYSVEDQGTGYQCNVYCYNVQPGVKINYQNGNNERSDNLLQDESKIIPFAAPNANESNPDLIYLICQQLFTIFADKQDSLTFTHMISDINEIAIYARKIAANDSNPAKKYMELKDSQYKIITTLVSYLPPLLNKQSFFYSIYNSP